MTTLKTTIKSSLKARGINAAMACLMFVMLFASCNRPSTSKADASFNPRDTVQVPEWLSGEDSICYIEDAIIQRPASAEDLLGLSEVHLVEKWLFYLDQQGSTEERPESDKDHEMTHRDAAALRLANRIMRMSRIVKDNAYEQQQWAIAVNAAIDTFCLAMPDVPRDSALNEVDSVFQKFTAWKNIEMIDYSTLSATIAHYHSIDAFLRLLNDVPADLKSLMQEEYEAWDKFNSARYDFWRDVSYNQVRYSLLSMERNDYYAYLQDNRQAELELQRSIIIGGKPYRQQGKTVTAPQWEKWIADNSVPKDYEYLQEGEDKELMPSDSIIAARVDALKSSFTRWLKVRQAIAAALPKEQGKSYDNLTADIHSRIIGKLPELDPTWIAD